jgi:SnoaL-like domain
MDAQGTMRLMFDTMDAYDRADFDRLAEIYAEDAQWFNADPAGPHCHNRDDIFAMFRQRMDAGIRISSRRAALDADRGPVDRPGQRVRPGGHRVQLPGTPHCGRQGLPLDGGRRGSARGSKPAATSCAVVAPVVASTAARFA